MGWREPLVFSLTFFVFLNLREKKMGLLLSKNPANLLMFFEFVSKRIRFDWVDWVEKEKNMVSLVSRTGRCLQRYDMKGYRQVVGCVILAVIFVEYVATFFFSLKSSFEEVFPSGYLSNGLKLTFCSSILGYFPILLSFVILCTLHLISSFRNKFLMGVSNCADAFRTDTEKPTNLLPLRNWKFFWLVPRRVKQWCSQRYYYAHFFFLLFI